MRSRIRLIGLVSAITFLFISCQKETSQLTPLNTTSHHIPVADGGPSKNVLLPATATLTGTGTSQNGPIVGYLWSLISGPNVPVIQSPSSPTTVISGLVVGNYILQFIVIDSMGYAGVDTAWIRVTAPAQVTLTLQPTTNHNELNFAVVGSANASDSSIDLDAAAWTNGGAPFLIRGATKFDLSSIPPGSTIISAKLSLYSNPTPINGDLVHPNSGSDNSMWIRRFSTNFTASASNWGNMPATETSTQVLIPHTALTTLDLIDVDVKNIVSSMMLNGNYGFQIGLQNEFAYNIRQFASSRHPNAALHPKLVVVYQ